MVGTAKFVQRALSRPFIISSWIVPRLTIGSLNMRILVSIFDRRTGESWKSIQCEVADRGEYALFGSYRVRQFLTLFPQKLVTSGAMRSKTKMNIYRRAGALVSNRNLDFFDQVPNAANHPGYPVTASSLGKHLIEKASRSRAIPRAYLPLAPRSTSIRRIAAEITASMVQAPPMDQLRQHPQGHQRSKFRPIYDSQVSLTTMPRCRRWLSSSESQPRHA
jgi:hypothetical protein